jgi:hypothetical protein
VIDKAARYMVSTYDLSDELHKDGDWRIRRRHLTPRGTIREIRKWRSRGYDTNCSIHVEREGWFEQELQKWQAATAEASA